jgi:hypothetical protein
MIWQETADFAHKKTNELAPARHGTPPHFGGGASTIFGGSTVFNLWFRVTLILNQNNKSNSYL